MSQSAVLVLSLTLVASEVQRGSAPLAVVLSRIGAPSDLQAVLRDQDVSTAEDVELLNTADRKAFGLSAAMRRRLLLCARDAEACDDDGVRIVPGRRLSTFIHLESKGACTDRRRSGKCAGKKQANKCGNDLWGCDLTCGRCNATAPVHVEATAGDLDGAELSSTSGANINALSPRVNRLHTTLSVSSVGATSTTSNGSSCGDRRREGKCKIKLQDGQCNTWGCDLTCGKCGAVRQTLADAEKRAVGQHSRESFWWVHHVKRHGGYATAVVPTLCKRVDRLSLLIDKLSLMSCIGEVMIVSRQLCIGIVQRIIDQHTATMAELGPHAEVVAVDMGGWDRIYGPAARFFAASRARQSVLVHLDDDEIPCEQQVCRLATQALQEPIGLYGHHKRVCTKETGYKVPANPNSKRWWHIVQFNVILTLFAATSRLVNDAFVRYFSPYAEALASTRGNGEDIAFNHFLLRHFNRTPTYVRKAECGDLIVNGSNVYDGGFSKLNDQVGISAGVHHYRLRKRMCRQLWFLQHWPAKRIGPQKYAGLIPLNHSVEGGQLSAV